jgi:hypothetical protein
MGRRRRKKMARKTGKQVADEIRASKSKYVTYGESDLGMPIPKGRAIKDFEAMDDEIVGDGEWWECDKNGNITE